VCASAAGADPAAQVHALISSAAGVGATGTGDAVADFPAQVGQFLVPRGRFAVEMFPSFMRLTGSSYEFKVAYKSVSGGRHHDAHGGFGSIDWGRPVQVAPAASQLCSLGC